VKKFIEGNNIDLRDVETSDAEFILMLRTDLEKSRFLHAVENDISQQIAYIERYKSLTNEWYFIIANKRGKRLGTIRFYDIRKDSFCSGSWILIDDAPKYAAMESFIVSGLYGFFDLNFSSCHFDVRKGNRKVWKFHERFGGIRYGETELEYLYTRSRKDFCRAILPFDDLIPPKYVSQVCHEA